MQTVFILKVLLRQGPAEINYQHYRKVKCFHNLSSSFFFLRVRGSLGTPPIYLAVSDVFNVNPNSQLTKLFVSSYPGYDNPQSSGLT